LGYIIINRDALRYKKILYLFFIIIFFSLALPSTLTAEEKAPYLIGPEDILETSVWKDLELTKQVIVRPDGKISFPLISEVDAGGHTVKFFNPARLCFDL